MRGLEDLRELVNPVSAEPDATTRLLTLAKTFQGEPDIAKRQRQTETAPRVEQAEPAKIEAPIDNHATWSAIAALNVLDAVLDPAFEETVAKQASREEPPGLHHSSGPRSCAGCAFYEQPGCGLYDWPVDANEICESWVHRTLITEQLARP